MQTALPISSSARTQILSGRVTLNMKPRHFFWKSELYIIDAISPLSDIEKDTSASSSEVVTSAKNLVNPDSPPVELPTGPLTEKLRSKLLGKSPLRLVMARSPQFVPPSIRPVYWIETLECGHAVDAYASFEWDEGGHLINLVPSAKRRRCQACKAIERANQFLPPKKPPVTEKRHQMNEITKLPARFLQKMQIDPVSGCWIWTGARRVKRYKDKVYVYGCFSRDGSIDHVVGSHAFAYEICKGPIPKGLEIDHTCQNKLCVNPDHLVAVAHQENCKRRPKSGPPKGQKKLPRSAESSPEKKEGAK